MMWLLTIEDDEGAVSHHALSTDRCTVGRAPDRDIVLEQANISRRHARFERRGGGWHVVDEGSDNGTFVNGCAIFGPTPFGVNDTLQLGDYRIAISAGEPVRRLPTPPPPPTPARLRVIAGLDVGAEYVFEPRDFMTIGSGHDVSLRFAHENVAPLHATIRALSGGRYELCDKSGTGLVFVNGHPVVGEQALEGGDSINIGGVVLLRFLEASQWPDPRFDMVSTPDLWLPIDLVPLDDAPPAPPTLPELPDVEPLAALEFEIEAPEADPPEAAAPVEAPPPAPAVASARLPVAEKKAAVAITTPPAGPAGGPAEPQGEDDAKPVSSRRKMLATLRRLASW